MGWKILFLFFAVAAAFDEDYPDSYNPECMEQIYNQCELESEDSTLDIPTNKEELQKACKIVLEFTGCATNILDNCEASDDIAKPFYNAQKVAKNICDENSKLFQAVEQNIECFNDNLDYLHQPCPLTPQETQDFNDIVNAFSAAEEDAFQNADMCIESLTRMGCTLSKLGEKCGEQAVEAMIEILLQLDKPFERCGPGVKENLFLIAGILDTEEELAEELEEMKKKKR